MLDNNLDKLESDFTLKTILILLGPPVEFALAQQVLEFSSTIFSSNSCLVHCCSCVSLTIPDSQRTMTNCLSGAHDDREVFFSNDYLTSAAPYLYKY